MLETLIGAVTEAVFGYLLEQAGLSEKVRTLLQRDPQRLAFQLALTRTYATFDNQHPQWTASLFDEHFLKHAAAPLLTRCLLRDNPPTDREMADTWANHLGLQDESRTRWLPDATAVSVDFLATFNQELRARAEFQPLFDSRAFDTTAEAIAQTAQSTAEMAQEMRRLQEELNGLLTRLMAERSTDKQDIHNPAPNQGAQGNFYGPVYFVNQPPQPPSNPMTTDPLPAAPPARTGENPFIAGNTVPPEHFYGRHDQRMSIKDRIGGMSPQCISIVGFRRSGKSSLLRYVRERIHEFCPPDQQPLVVSLSLSDRRFHTPEGITEGLRRSIAQATGSAPWQREDNSDAWAVDDGLHALRDSGRRLIVQIDEFEQIGARLAAFQDWGGDWREKAGVQGYCALVIATLRPIDEIYQELGLTSPFGNIFTATELGAFLPNEWHTLVRDGFSRTGADLSDSDLDLLDDLAGGLPYYTQLAATLLWRHSDHVRTRATFVQQTEPRFAELWRDLTDQERHTLRHAAGLLGLPAPAASLRMRLQRRGLLRSDAQLWSSVFAEWVQEQR